MTIIEGVMKIKSQLKLNQYISFELPGGELIVQNSQGVSRITDSRLKAFLLEWDSKSNSLIEYNDIHVYMGEETSAAVDFLKSLLVITDFTPPNLGIDTISFYTNNDNIGSLLKNVLDEDYSPFLKCNYIYDEKLNINHFDTNSNELIVVFMNPYNRKFAKEIRDLISQKKDTFLIFSYTYNSSFYIDSLYNGFFKSPCHICHISYIESQLRITNGENITYQQMVDSLYADNNYYQIETPLNFNGNLNVATQLTNRIGDLFLADINTVIHPEAFNESSVYNLITKKVHKDNPIHWEMCDCYE
ncbi:McbB family protein [Sporosarcina limicola]|uniref:McbB family protein n=1 Tax=Sporosarcina limicola TaxID=34101 RepID=A0A927R1Y3_9BACL|nr:McbB family protein [Sporosarcina limicola]MBE1553291.1 McbB family protein [Sporosarcina limicola]